MFFFLDTFPDSASWRLVRIFRAHPGFYLHEDCSVEQDAAKMARDSIVVFSEKAERKIYAPVCSQIRSNGDKETSFVDPCVIRPQRLT